MRNCKLCGFSSILYFCYYIITFLKLLRFHLVHFWICKIRVSYVIFWYCRWNIDCVKVIYVVVLMWKVGAVKRNYGWYNNYAVPVQQAYALFPSHVLLKAASCMSKILRMKLLLAQAVQCLDRGGGASSSAVGSDSEHTDGIPGPLTSTARSSSIASTHISMFSERNSLFNFSKRSTGSRSASRKKETWFCMPSKTNGEKTLTCMESATLTSLGEEYINLNRVVAKKSLAALSWTKTT